MKTSPTSALKRNVSFSQCCELVPTRPFVFHFCCPCVTLTWYTSPGISRANPAKPVYKNNVCKITSTMNYATFYCISSGESLNGGVSPFAQFEIEFFSLNSRFGLVPARLLTSRYIWHKLEHSCSSLSKVPACWQTSWNTDVLACQQAETSDKLEHPWTQPNWEHKLKLKLNLKLRCIDHTNGVVTGAA